MRVSGGHLCEAEAPTEPIGETADPYVGRGALTPLSIYKPKGDYYES